MNLRTKLGIFPIALAIIMLFISLLFTLKIHNKTVKEQTVNHLISNAQARARNIEMLLKNYTDVAQILSVSKTFELVVDSKFIRTEIINEVNNGMARTIKTNPNIVKINVLNKDGIVVASTNNEIGNNLSGEVEFTKAVEGIFFGEIHKSQSTGNLILSTSSAIKVRDVFAGVLIIHFEVEEHLFNIMTNRVGLGETEEIYLVNKEGYLITPSKFKDDTILEKKINTEQVNLCIMEHVESNLMPKMDEIPTVYISYTGRKVLGTHRYISETQWGVIAEFDIREANKPIRDNIVLMLSIFVVLIIITTTVGFLITRNTILQIIKFQKGTEEIMKGNLDHKVGIKSTDEIGILSRSFDAMTSKLKTAQNKLLNYTEDLESKVKERTAELKMQFEESEKQRLANLIIMKDLDAKTKELKAEINERELAEKDLGRSEYKFRLLANNTYDWEYWLSSEGKYLFLSKACERITGYSTDDFYQNPDLFFSLVHPDYVDMVRNHYNDEEEKHLPVGKIEFQIHDRNGDIRWIEHNCIPVFNEEGNFMGRRGNNRDITERKQAEEKVKKAHKLLEELYQHQNNIRENERKAVSREIHDELGQFLSALKIDLGWTKDNVGDRADVKKKINGMISTVSETIRTVQRISSDLRPGLLDDLGLVPAIEWYCQKFHQRTGIEYNFVTDGTQASDENKNLALYRILQEALTNVMRHAKAKHVEINLHRSKEFIILKITDDGIGMKMEQIQSSKSLGFIGIHERVKQFNGKVYITSTINKGTIISIKIPFD
ncbi:cache domain-containing protein [uncultured Draconibacterium sp.]|uniref:cache domain-containing protein n=1 Tax=uncultured Draconibacterium sp. TaxID=1573823 RepID=UPI00321731EF